MKDKAFYSIKNLVLIKTQAEHLLEVLHKGTVSTNVFLRRLHNFALDMNWIPKSIIPKRQWPKIQFQDKRPITFAEHQKIIACEKNPEYLAYYEMLWHLAAHKATWQICARRILIGLTRRLPIRGKKPGATSSSISEKHLKKSWKPFRNKGRFFRISEHHARPTYFKRRCALRGGFGRHAALVSLRLG